MKYFLKHREYIFIPIYRFVLVVFLIIIASSNTNSQTVEERIDNIISQMTLEEKILQLHKEGAMNTASNQRLDIPGFVMADGPHGVRDGMATSFPVGIGIAATWDINLAQRVGKALGEEFRGKGKNQMLGPAIDLNRDPRNGRSPESGGEDPYLNAQITSAIIKGIQSTPIVATAKHYNCVHKQTERFSNNYTMTQRWLMEHYGLNFRTAVQDAGVFSVMSAYNKINEVQSAESYNLLTTILRDSWGFPFYVVSDWGAVHNSEKAIKAGTDICMGSDHYQNDLYNLVTSGTVSEDIIDQAVRRVLRIKIVSGMLNYYPPGDPNDVNSIAHKQLCLEAGKKSLVLLKDEDNILPMNKNTINSILVVGPNAAVMRTDGAGSSWVTPFYSISPKEGIENYIGVDNVLYAEGCDISTGFSSDVSEAFQMAEETDVVIFFGGLDPSQEGEGLDRANGSILLPGVQSDLINMLASKNENIVVVLISGGIGSATPFIDNVKGLIYGFYPGQEGGNAIAQVLFGDYNPGGKLPVTMPKSDSQLPTEIKDFDFTNDYGCGYRWFDRKNLVPEFAFGFGLSYTTFSYSNLHIMPSLAPIGEIIEVSVDVTNTGIHRGEEVIQMYLTYEQANEEMPLKELKAFNKIELEPNGVKTVNFRVTPNELYQYNEMTMQYEIKTGMYTICVGGSSDNLPLVGNFELTSATPKPDLQIASLKAIPPYPLKDEKVQFLATIVNRGTGPSPQDEIHEVVFSVNGYSISKSVEFQNSIPAGGMALIYGTFGIDGDYTWTANEIGQHTIEAIVNPNSSISETMTNNNSRMSMFEVYSKPPVNLALNKDIIVSSIEGAGLEGEKAVDGDYSSRWSSQFSDPQYLIIDFGTVEDFNQVKLFWETAYGKEYKIEISNDKSNWSTIVYQTNGIGGIEQYKVDASARYLRIYGIKRGTSWGYSLYEMEVYNIQSINIEDEGNSGQINDYCLLNNYPNPFNPITKIEFNIPSREHVSLIVYNLLGKEIEQLVNEDFPPGNYSAEFNGSNLSSGIYFYKLETENFIGVKKMILMK